MPTGNTFTVTHNPLQSFLDKHKVQRNQPYNFTSVAKPFGSYYVPPEQMPEFYILYERVVSAGVMPFLTEKPGKFSPVLIDFDFKFDVGYTGARYTPEFVDKVVAAYFDFFGGFIRLTPENNKCYVLERGSSYEAVDKNGAPKCVKDGLHLVFPGITCPTELKLLAREHIIQEHADLFSDLDAINSIEDIVDRAVIDRNNWFVIGSGKPGCEAYKVTTVIDHEGNRDTAIPPLADLLTTLSVKGPVLSGVQFIQDMQDVMEETYREMTRGNAPSTSSGVTAAQLANPHRQNRPAIKKGKFDQIENLDFVKKLVQVLSPHRADDYYGWMQVGWCLHNISTDLLPSWIQFSQQSSKYETGCCDCWNDMRHDGLGMGSLVRWVKEDNPQEYERIRREDIKTLLSKSVGTGGASYAVARVLYAMYRYQYVCLSRKYGSWIEFRTHRWHRIEQAHNLQTKLSNELYEEYAKLASETERLRLQTDDDEERKNIDTKCKLIRRIGTSLLDTTFKKKVMTEAGELFFIENFEEKLDANRDLLSFENGVYDLEELTFRDGRPEDFITLSTGIDYIEYDEGNEAIQTTLRLMSQIHVDVEIREYVLTSLATYLSGQIRHQKFLIWTGSQGCFAPGTEALRWGGGTVKVENIFIGDELMGDDGTPRTVTDLYSGEQEMFRIVPVKGESHVVNLHHYLPLAATNTIVVSKQKNTGYSLSWQERSAVHVVVNRSKKFSKTDFGTLEKAKAAAEAARKEKHASANVIQRGDIVEVRMDKYLEIRKRIGPRWYMLHRAPSTYDTRVVHIDAWLLGYWLGDGNKHNANMTTADEEVVTFYQQAVKAYGMEVVKSNTGKYLYIMRMIDKNIRGRKGSNFLREKLSGYELIESRFIKGDAGNIKHIPDDYKYNSREIRLQVLAGLIDSDGHYQQRNKQFEFTNKSERLMDDVIFLARSLGFAAYKFETWKTCTNALGGPKRYKYFRTQIFGEGLEEIPVKIERKVAAFDRTKKRSALVTNFKVEPLGVGPFNGFQLDGNHRFLLADHTVHVNSNGKSFTIELFMKAMGQYTAILPISLLTAKRSASNAASPELARTKGRRFCVLQEPDADVQINCGLMKELSGGDKIVARDLFCPVIEFKPQFKLVLTCNKLPEIPGNDGGTWRRIRVVEFKSRFLDNPDPENPYHFQVDQSLGERMDELSQAFMAILVKYYKMYCRNDRKLVEPEEVMRATNEYKKRNDTYAEFVTAHVVRTEDLNDIVRLSDVYHVFKEWYKANRPEHAKAPNSNELREYLDSDVLKSEAGIWRGLRVCTQQDEPDFDEEE